LDAERLAGERADAERRERELLEAARAERERAEKAMLEAQRLEEERLAHARLEAEREEQEEARERAEQELAEKARQDAARLEEERLAYTRLEGERAEQEAARERTERARVEAERVAAEARERDRGKKRQEDAVRAPAPKEEERGGWLVPPDQAVKFEPPRVDVAPPAAATRAYPVYVPPSEPAAWMSDIPPERLVPEVEPVAAASAPVAAPMSVLGLSSGTGPIRLKDDAPAIGVSKWARAESRHEPDDENISAAEAYEPFRTEAPPREIPWKLIAAGVVLIATAIAIKFGYAPSSGPILETVKKVAPTSAAAPAAPAAASGATRLAITTEPAGARVTIDGKPAGETPLMLDTISVGRHVVTVTGATGVTAKRTVRVEAGKTAMVEIPLFSGFVLVSAPFVIEVSENGKIIGSSDDQIILSQGSHTLHLANKDLGYVATETVEIQGSETTRVALDPRGRANINASPWAEVYIDGEKAGDTPLANIAIRLGVREIVFKNPQFGERKVTTTITANAPATISVDFIK
jgi:hypothetical protein